MKDFLLQRGKYENISRIIFLSIPLIIFTSVITFLSRHYWLFLVPIILGFISIKYFSHTNFDRMIYYVFFIGSILFGLFFGLNLDQFSSSYGYGLLILYFSLLFFIIFMGWFVIKLILAFRSRIFDRVVRGGNFSKSWFKGKTFTQKFGTIFAIIITLLNIFISYSHWNCRDFGCIFPTLLGWVTLVGFPGTGIPYLIGNQELNGLFTLISSIILIPIYYFIGKFFGKIVDKVHSNAKKDTQNNI